MNYSLDIECLALKPKAVVMSIGIACANGNTLHLFLPKIPQLRMQRVINSETLEWWNHPDRLQLFIAIQKRMEAAEHETTPMANARNELFNFLAHNADGNEECIWMNSPAFDNVILEDLFKRDCNLAMPWHYRSPRCLRTLRSCAEIKTTFPFHKKPVGAHDALIDAKYQLEIALMYLKALRN